jgi:hypothetical protein
MIVKRRFFGVATLWLPLSVFMACKQQEFSGGSGTVKPAKQRPNPNQNTDDQVTPQEGPCTEAKLIALKSLTTAIDQQINTRSVDVQLTFAPCPNQKTELTYPLWFDLDANIDFGPTGSKSLQYELSGSGIQASQGNVVFQMGTDLFGKSGPEYGHFESSSPMRASPLMTSAILKIKLGGMKILGPSLAPVPVSGNFQIPLHVKVGQAAPVTGMLTFTQPY